MRNRRKNTRVKVPGTMDATITYTDTMTDARSGTVENVSRNGIFLRAEFSLSKDAYVALRLNTGQLIGKPLCAQGFVARADENGMGIRFTYIEQDILTLLFS
ncbi:MAG: PilZ domain-containing protein [Desulfomonilia bacterium]|nr:PilZ domain-containing protein [Desulfomonilia bacterium]